MSSGGGSAPSPPKFTPINTQDVAQQALGADIQGYQMSDADYAKRFPQLVSGRDLNISDALNNLKGGTSPIVSNALSASGLSRDLGSTETKKARNLGMPISDLQSRDRNYFYNMFTPERTAGLTGQDIAHIAIANTNNANSYNQGTFGSRINAYNAGVGQNIQNTSALYSGLAALIGAGGKSYAQSQYFSPQGYGSMPGIYYPSSTDLLGVGNP